MSVKNKPTNERQLQQNSVDVIVTVNGGRETANSVLRGGGMVGMESAGTRPPSYVPINFVDWPFTKPEIPFEERWKAHLDMVRKECPRYAVAPDVDGVSLRRVLDYADELSRYAETVIVVPKDVRPSEIPDEYRVGMPCQERFGKPPWKWTDYQSCKSVHLLGGSPSKHQEIKKHYVNVRSIDTASIIKAAGFGKVWSEDRWLQRNSGFYDAVEASVVNINFSWETDFLYKASDEKSLIYHLIDGQGYPDKTLIHPDEEMPFPGRTWIVNVDKC